MWVLFKYICTMSGLFIFLLILSSCNASHKSGLQPNMWSSLDVNANAIFKIERRIKSDLSSFYSIGDRILFVSRQDRNRPYEHIQSVHVDGECYSELGRSIRISRIIPSNVFYFHTFLSLAQLLGYSNKHSSTKKHIDQTYQCHFSFIGTAIDGSTKSVQNIRLKIPKKPSGGIIIHHRDDKNKSGDDKLEFTELDFKNYHVAILNPSPNAHITLRCSDFQESVDFKSNPQNNLASIFNLQKHYSLLLSHPLQNCYITYGNFGDPYWAWSKPFQLLFKEAFEDIFDLKFDLRKITDSHILQLDQNEQAGGLWIQLGILEINNPFSEPILISLDKNHNTYLNAYIYYIEDKGELNYRGNDSLIKKENHNIFLQFAQTGNRRDQNKNTLNIFGGPNYAFYINSKSSIKRQIVIKILDESHYSSYEVLGIEIIKLENPHQQNFLKVYFHNNRGSSFFPIFDEFKDEALVSICAFKFCHRAFELMLYNNKIRTGQIF